MKIALTDIRKTQKLGVKLAEYVLDHPQQKNIFFFGEVGMGKTTCIQACAKKLGVSEDVQSPTFALISEYFVPANEAKIETFVHIDMYRCKDSCALSTPEMMEKIDDEESLVAIEWAEYFPPMYLPQNRIEVYLQSSEMIAREAEVKIFAAGKMVEN